jgi:hypothetical protein
MASLWKYVAAESFVHYLQEFCVAWTVEPAAVSDILGAMLEGCNQQVRDQFLTLSYEPEESPSCVSPPILSPLSSPSLDKCQLTSCA